MELQEATADPELETWRGFVIVKVFGDGDFFVVADVTCFCLADFLLLMCCQDLASSNFRIS